MVELFAAVVLKLMRLLVRDRANDRSKTGPLLIKLPPESPDSQRWESNDLAVNIERLSLTAIGTRFGTR